MNRIALTAAVAALALAVGACSSDDDEPEASEPTPTVAATALAPGACLASEQTTSPLGDIEVTEDAVVDCSAEHVYEVVTVQDIPLEYLAGPDPVDTDRDTLLAAIGGADATAVQTKFRAWASTICAVGVQRATGLDDLEIGGSSSASVQALPYSRTSAPVATLPAEGWSEQPLLVCVNRFSTDSDVPAEAPVAPVTGSATERLLTAEVPVAQRSCFTFDAAGNATDLPCSEPHYAERVLTLDATRLLDDEELAAASIDPAAPFADEVAETLDGACQDALGRVVGEGFDEEILTARALRGPLGWGTGGYVNSVVCHVTAADDQAFDLPAGSVIGLGDAELELVPVEG